MRILFFETTNATPHLETSLELARKHLDQGDQVLYYFLGHAVGYSEFVFSVQELLPRKCLPERRGAKLLMHPQFKFISLKKKELHCQLDLPCFEDIDELREFRYWNYEAGLSALSSLISHTRSSKPDLSLNQELIKRILSSGISVYDFCLDVLKNNPCDLVYLFNGRFANNRAILDAAIETGMPYLIHERGADKSRYTARPFMPHDFEKVRHEMSHVWDRRLEGSENIATKFFTQQRGGAEQGWTSFVKGQIKSHISIEQQLDKRLICYFSSSDDEYASVGDMVKWDRWLNQLSAVHSLIDIVRNQPTLELLIRIHPHMAQKDPSDLQDWIDLDLPLNARLLLPSDPTDSYALIERADVVVTSGSTVGIESVYWGTPSICLGPALYSHLDAVHLPKDNTELKRMLLDQSLPVRPENALPYGYYMATFGESFYFYQPETLFRGRFMGLDLQRSGLCGLVRRGLSFAKRLMLAGRKSIGRLMGLLN